MHGLGAWFQNYLKLYFRAFSFDDFIALMTVSTII